MNTKLLRHLGFFSLIVYGLGDILGAGIYSLVGKVVGIAGPQAWMSFVLAAVTALITGLSYAECAARFPVAAGAAAFVKRAFNNNLLGTVMGVVVLGTGLASAATITVAFTGYFTKIWALPPVVVHIIFVVALSFLSFWGILLSSRVNMLLTLVEFSGLVAVIVVGFKLVDVSSLSTFWQNSVHGGNLSAVLTGVTVAFFAYIGFEDLCNLASEAKDPAKDIPRAILIGIIVSTILYLLVTIVLQLSVPAAKIATSEVPLLLIFEQAGLLFVVHSFAFIAMLAVGNTGLANAIMASRLLYGMTEEGLLPAYVGKVHTRRHTPWVAILITALSIYLLVFTGGLKELAQTTSLLIFLVFFAVHVSLFFIKWRHVSHDGFKIPIIIPVIGGALCLMTIFRYPAGVYARTIIILCVGIFLWACQRFAARRKGL